ncbi:MAG: hypothetical protein CMG41_04260 [Candidatus Marinimicrobia bacterium]|jgi:hypothetical protein|nr:hypothetical protein [Candidatus Neomarinimicrobiota bacterium]
MSFFRPRFMQSWLDAYQRGGIKELLSEKGWKVLLAFFLFYLVRDSILYIIIPWIGYNHLSTFF